MDFDGERTQAYADDRNAEANREFDYQFLALLEMPTMSQQSI